MTDLFAPKAEVEKKASESNGYITHKRDGNKLIIQIDLSKAKETASGKAHSVFLRFQESGRSVWGNIFVK